MMGIFVVDNFAAAYYSVDNARSASVHGALRIMEISNREEVRPLFEKLHSNILTFPTALMMYTALKFYVMYVLNILAIASVVPSAWNNLVRNKESTLSKEKMYILKSNQAINLA